MHFFFMGKGKGKWKNNTHFSQRTIKSVNETRLQLVISYEITALLRVTPFRTWFAKTIRKTSGLSVQLDTTISVKLSKRRVYYRD